MQIRGGMIRGEEWGAGKWEGGKVLSVQGGKQMRGKRDAQGLTSFEPPLYPCFDCCAP